MSLATDAKVASSEMYCEQCCESLRSSCILLQFTRPPTSSGLRQKSFHLHCSCHLRYETGHGMYVQVSLVSTATSWVADSESIVFLRAKIDIEASPLLFILNSFVKE